MAKVQNRRKPLPKKRQPTKEREETQRGSVANEQTQDSFGSNYMNGGQLNWRDTMKPVRFAMLDARAGLILLLTLLHLRPWTLITAITTTLIFHICEKYGLTFYAALRALRRLFVGPMRPRIIWTQNTKMIDYALSSPYPIPGTFEPVLPSAAGKEKTKFGTKPTKNATKTSQSTKKSVNDR